MLGRAPPSRPPTLFVLRLAPPVLAVYYFVMVSNALGQLAADAGQEHADERGSATTTPLLQRLRRALKKIDRPGSFCASGDVRLTHPGLDVKGVGPIGLPLSAAQAKELKKRCKQAPYGKGESTVVDTSVRRVWRLDPGEFSLTNEDWGEALAEIVGRAEEALGLEKERLECHLYDLLLYEPGSFFLPHRDGERLNRMVATLVITLPSAFRGGELVVRHDGEERTIDFGGKSSRSLRLHYAAFYADCEHEIRRLEEGYRLSLIYNLTLSKAGKKISAPHEREHVDAVREILRDWAHDEPDGKLVITLDHQYSEAGLTWDTLKGSDRVKARVLCEAAKDAGCKAYLSLVTFHESGAAEYADPGEMYSRRRRRSRDEDELDGASEYEMIEVFDSSLVAEHLRDQGGVVLPVAQIEIDLDEDDLLDPEALTKVKPKEEFEGFTGNEGMTLDRWYRHAAILVWPERRHFDVLCEQNAPSVVPLLTEMVAQWRRASGAEAKVLKAQCMELASRIVAYWPERRHEFLADEVPGAPHLLTAIVHIGERKLIKQYLEEVISRDDRADPGEGLVAACEEHGWKTFEGQLLSICRRSSRGALERNVRILEEICTARPRKKEGHAALCRALAREVVSSLVELDQSKGSMEWAWRDLDRGGLLAALVRALVASDQPKFLERLLSHALAHSTKYPLVKAHVGALERLEPWLQKNLEPPCPAVLSWIGSCRERFEALTAKEPEEPTDFRRPAAARCKCVHCKELNHFLADPREEVHGFREVQQVRKHIEAEVQVKECDVVCKTERRGSPHLLVCTKTKASFHRSVAKYHDDLKHLAKVRSIEASLAR